MRKKAEKERLFAIRRKRLAELVAEAGGQAALARRLGGSSMSSLGNASYLNRMLSGKPREKGGKNIEGDTASEIERYAGKPAGWLSRDEGSDSSLLIGQSVWDQLEPDQQQAIEKTINAMIAGFLAQKKTKKAEHLPRSAILKVE